MPSTLDHVSCVQSDAEDGNHGTHLQDCPRRPVETRKRLFIAELQCEKHEAFQDDEDQTKEPGRQGKVKASVYAIFPRRVFDLQALVALHHSAKPPGGSKKEKKNSDKEGPVHCLGLWPMELVHETSIVFA